MSAESKRHMGKVKGMPCSVCGVSGPSDARHILDGRTPGRKSQDWLVIPLCKDCHQGEDGMTSVFFIVPGVAVGKGRPKFARRGNFVTAYTPEKTASYENLVKLAAHRAMNGRETIAVAVSCAITIEVEPAPSWSNKKRMAALSGDIRPTSKPDLDNVAKGILDAMNDIVFKDDKQVVSLTISKRYSEQSMASVEVVAL